MAAPQIENGYTKISNELLEALCKYKISPTQLRILLFIARYTYGFGRKKAELSNSFISDGIGIDKTNVSREINLLIEKNIVIVFQTPTFNKPRIIGINKDYDSWQNWGQYSELTTPVSIDYTTVVRTDYSPVVKTDNQERKHKENYKENIYTSKFQTFYSDYPRKQKRAEAEKAFMKLKPSDELFDTMLAALKNQKQSEDWQKENGRYIPLPSSWLNGRRWEDENTNEEVIQCQQPQTTQTELSETLSRYCI